MPSIVLPVLVGGEHYSNRVPVRFDEVHLAGAAAIPFATWSGTRPDHLIQLS